MEEKRLSTNGKKRKKRKKIKTDVIHIFIDSVDKKGKSCSHKVDRNKIVCYNNGMKNLFQKTEEYIERCRGELKEKFDFFRNLLFEYNQKYNLTAITEEKEVFYKHFIDSVMGESGFFHGATVAEVGSGAGFPSIPLKLYRNDLTFTLFESTGKKCDFLQTVVDKLQLKGVIVRNLRAEDAGRNCEYREKFDICTARAVARLNILAEYCIPFIKKGGRWIAYKGSAEEEIVEAKRAVRLLGCSDLYSYRYSLPENYGERTLVYAEKTENTPERYPRGNGQIRSKPL